MPVDSYTFMTKEMARSNIAKGIAFKNENGVDHGERPPVNPRAKDPYRELAEAEAKTDKRVADFRPAFPPGDPRNVKAEEDQARALELAA